MSTYRSPSRRSPRRVGRNADGTAVFREILLAALEAALLLHGSLGGRIRLEPLVRNRLAAFDREPIRPLGETLLRSRHRFELLLEALAEPLVALLLEELGCLVRRMLTGVGELVVPAHSERSELSLDPRALGCQELLCSGRVHGRMLVFERLGCGGEAMALEAGELGLGAFDERAQVEFRDVLLDAR